MSRIDDSLASLLEIKDTTERALELAGLISTLFKIRGVTVLVTGQLAFDSYANSSSSKAELDLAIFSGKITPRLLQEIMGEQLHGKGAIERWTVAGIPVRFAGETHMPLRELCRDFMTEHGVVKLLPAEQIAAERILAAVYPIPNQRMQDEVRLLLINALSEAFAMDWPALQQLCHHPDYRVGEELAQMRTSAKKDVDALGVATDPIGLATSVGEDEFSKEIAPTVWPAKVH